MLTKTCSQCGEFIDNKTRREIKDSCGHYKCRVCLLTDEYGCKQCSRNELEKSCSEASLLQNETNYKDSLTENIHTTVITFNNNHDQKEFNKFVQDSKDATLNTEISNVNNKSEDGNIKTQICVKSKKISKSNSKPTSLRRNYETVTIPNHVSFCDRTNLYTCNICGSMFKTKSRVKYHTSCEQVKKPFMCDVCSKTYSLKSQLLIHKHSHSGNKPYKCNICEKAFREHTKLKRHSILHSNQRPFVCDECGKNFKGLNSLKAHRFTHTENKPYGCKICDMKFNNTSNLRRHESLHSDEKSHMCEKCGKKFKHKWALTVHKKSHSLKRDFICGLCNRAFTNKKDLKRHVSIHSDAKIYSCGLCSVSFRRKDNLGRHIRNSHPDKKTECLEKIESIKLNEKVIDNPNAVNVITVSPVVVKKIENFEIQNCTTPTETRKSINGPLKLAFKTSAFKKNYNINRDCSFESNVKGETPSTSTNEESELRKASSHLTSSSPPRIFPDLYSAPNLSVDFFSSRPQVIKNIKFKIPENFPTRDEGILRALMPQINLPTNEKGLGNSESGENVNAGVTSVIVNSSNQKNLHWRRRMSQNIGIL